ncbi:Short-chain dehydrogenase/reductase SDR [Penicillium italicum]|uniref:Short-chain dehydrogenase/reductase SDR n=1 Tax=Penicillium italicum TaxID=40296 RepID=A0A0A2LE09_PENIT|nr:Short-chain dehydrogenase/reductase SDR [Penicillium italicum]
MARVLEGKFGIVTGGSRGIGEAIARNLAAKGCSLLLNFTSESSRGPTEALCSSLATTHNIKCESVQADLSKPTEAVTDIIGAAQKHFSTSGKLQIDILINNAGVSQDRNLNDATKGPIEAEHFNWHYAINVLAPLLLTQACAPFLPTDRSGRIVSISSISSSLGFVGQSIYGGTKAAIEAMTRTWARELADRATVNAVNPGPVVGDMYFATGEQFWKDIQGFQDNTPLSKLDVNNQDTMSRLTDEQKRLIQEKMGGRRPAFTSEVAGVVGMLSNRVSSDYKTNMPDFSFPPGFSIPTPRLQISPFNPADPMHCAFLVQLWNTEDFLSSCGNTGITTPEKASSFLENKTSKIYAHYGYGMFLVSRPTDDGMKPVGTVSLINGVPPDAHYLAPDIGFAMLPEECRKGYATEAAKALLEYAKKTRGVDDVFGFCSPTNQRSRATLEKLGMEFRGIRPLHVFGNKESAVYVLPGMSEDLSIYNVV